MAVVPPLPVCDDVARAVARLPSSLRAELRRIPPERFHLTLTFLGDVEDVRVGPLAEALAALARSQPPIDLQVAGSGHFQARVLWLGLRGDVEPLESLAADVARAAVAVGVRVQEKPYYGHLTVARPRGQSDVCEAVTALSSYAGIAWQATELVLMRSRLGLIPSYEKQAGWPLLGGVAERRARPRRTANR